MLHETLCALDHHLGDAFMMLRKLVEGGIDHFHIIADDGFFNIRYFLRAFIDQKDQNVNFRIVFQDRSRDAFQQGCFSGFRRRNDHPSLAFSDRRYKIHDPHRQILFRGFQTHAFIREDRSQLLKRSALCRFTRKEAVDPV